MFDQSKADQVCEFVELLNLTGDFTGQKMKLLPWQREGLSQVYGTVKENGSRQYKYAYWEIAKKNGKALALDTPIPTPTGWATMGELNVGDYVLGADGRPCRVTFATDVMFDHKCYDVHFSDGTVITADADHRWITNAWIDGNNDKKHNKQDNRRYDGSIRRVRTTQEIKDTLKVNRGTTNNHSIDVCSPLILPEVELPIPPYTFGAWIGDGCSHKPSIICCDDDYDTIIGTIMSEGIPITKYKSKSKTAKYGMTTSNRDRTKDCVQKRLKELGVFKNKHIPQIYLRASYQQRRELLRGLMDTDGTCSKKGQCSYTTTSYQIAEGVFELLCSLGYKPTMHRRDAKLYGRYISDAYTVQFYAFKDNPCFHLQRKAERLKERTKKTRSGVRHITDVIEVPSVPVRCIQVDNADHLYLCGKSMIPTHNTELIGSLGVYHLFTDPPGGQIYCCAADREQASLVYMACKSKIEQDPYLEKFFHITESKKTIENPETGTFLKVLSAESYTKHGINPTVIIFDELHAQPNRDLWDVMTFGSGASRKEQLVWIITTAGDDPDRKSIGWEQHDYAAKVISGEIEDPTYWAKIYSYDGDDIFNEDNWYKANPSLGITIDIDNVREEAIGAKNKPANEKLFRWLRLNQWVQLKRVSWLPITLWDATEADWTLDDMRGRECYVGVDLSSTTDLTGISFLFPPNRLDGETMWCFAMRAFIPADNMPERERRDHVPFSDWVRQEFVTATEGAVVDFKYLASYLSSIEKLYRVKYYCADPYKLEYLRQWLPDKPADKFVAVKQNIAGMSPAMQELERMLRAGEIEHEVNPMGRWCFGNVIVSADGNENIKPMKNKSIDRIDPVDALVDAMAVALVMEPKGSVYEERGIRSL